ncbi:unnamed protein product [Anisakis simplex]|uniref:EB domain-containing protein n=1 Tax=Anisakis simplex TaxID=6269 RepID=A0A0M3K7W5_ANISI|nr:unnamed protein product [Anisakis simplex]
MEIFYVCDNRNLGNAFRETASIFVLKNLYTLMLASNTSDYIFRALVLKLESAVMGNIMFSVYSTAIIYLAGLLVTVEANGMAQCNGRAYFRQPITYVYLKDNDNCFGFRKGCEPHNLRTYPTLQSCADDNFKDDDDTRSFSMSCGLGYGVETASDGLPVITFNCTKPESFCSPSSLCYTADKFSFCCVKGRYDSK